MTVGVSPEFLALQSALAGRYSLERELGRGGMGIVVLARDVALDRLVAVKLLPPMLAARTGLREQFLLEARTAAGLSHPNIVPIHTVEEHGDLVFFVMGYVDGETLRQRVDRTGPISARMAMRLIQEVAWALTYAHDNGIVHRDIKPDNIMVERASGRALVTDFGIARVGTSDSVSKGEVIGTARYMSPEQATGDDVDPRSDLYSLGATAFFALTARAPFEAPSLPALLAKHVVEAAPPVASVRKDVPQKLAALVDRCLAKDPQLRFASGKAIAEAIGELRGRELRAPPLVRNFLRNAQVTTAVFITAALVGQGSENPGIVDLLLIVLLVQLLSVARKLLREGHSFADIRAALLAEASAQEEEADAAGQRKFMRRLNGFWHRVWASRFGRFFFRVAGIGMRRPARPAVPSTEATETILGRAAVELFESLPGNVRTQFPGARKVIHRLEEDAEALRKKGGADETRVTAVTALERVRVELLRLEAGEGSVDDLSSVLARARDIGDRIERELAARNAMQ